MTQWWQPVPDLYVNEPNPFIFTSPGWVTQSKGVGFNTTISITQSAGSYKTVRFIGDTVFAYGPPEHTIKTSSTATVRTVAHFSIDGGEPSIYRSPDLDTDYFGSNQFLFMSPPLPMGEHVLTVTNMVDGGILATELFYIVGPRDGPPPELLRSNGARIPGGQAPAPAPAPGGRTTIGSSTPVASSSRLSSVDSTTPTLVPLSTTVRGTTVISAATSASHSTSSDPNGLLAPVTTYQSTVINAPSTRNFSKAHNIPAIVLGTCGALLVILLAAVLIVLRRRSRQRSAAVASESLTPYSKSDLDSSQIYPAADRTVMEKGRLSNQGEVYDLPSYTPPREQKSLSA